MSKLNHIVDRPVLLTKALLNVAALYELCDKELSEIIGISEADISRLKHGTKLLSEKSQESELALLLIRLYRSLNAIAGDDSSKAKAWLHSYNDYFSAAPIDHIKRIEGLVAVVNYLDAMHAKP